MCAQRSRPEHLRNFIASSSRIIAHHKKSCSRVRWRKSDDFNQRNTMKVGVVGCGFVGSSAAFAMVLRGVASEVALMDINAALASAQAEDILHAVPFGTPARITAGDYSALKN